MPKVPRYSPQVRDQATPAPRFSTSQPLEAFGGGNITRQMQEGVGAFAGLIAKEQEKADEVRILEFENKLAQLELDLQYNEEYGILNKKGMDASEAISDIEQRWHSTVNGYMGELKGDRQKFAAEKRASARWNSLNKNVHGHAHGEQQKFEAQQLNSFLDNEVNAAVANFTDPDRIALSLERQSAEIESFVKRNNVSEEVKKAMLQDQASKTHMGIINRMLANGQDLHASGYYRQVKDSIAGTHRAAIEKSLEEGSLRGQSQRLSDKILGEAQSLSEAMETVRNIKDPKVRDATQTRVRDEFALRAAQDAQAREALFQQAALYAESTMQRPEPAIWTQLTLTERKAIDDRIKQMKSGIPPTTDWETYYDLMLKAANPLTKPEFLRTNLMVHRPDLSNAEFKELVKLQKDMRNGDDKVIDGFRNSNTVINNALTRAGIDPSKMNKKQKKRHAEFLREVDSQVMEFQDRAGRKATNREIEDIADDLLIKGRVEGTGVTIPGLMGRGPRFWATKGYQFEHPEADWIVEKADDLPPKTRATIERFLRDNGYKVTNRNIVNLYNQQRGRQIEQGKD
jgi:hypothetical protein